ncbi:MAG: tRNA dihydrouridine(20/20a) synthase DusA [Pseudomonadota bacterium]
MAEMAGLTSPYRFCVAPMMDGTDRHCRYFHRILTKRARLYTEMIIADAVIHGDRKKLLDYSQSEHPVVLQLGGAQPDKLREAAAIGEDFGYDEINLNVGCPSDRVQSGTFGACLMQTPALVAECVAAMVDAVRVPITVKCRIGVDDQDPAEALPALVDWVSGAGVQTIIVHARKAWLQGLSPKQNREVPPLDYGLVATLKASRPDLTIVLNGGISSIDECQDHLKVFDGVMLGRAAYGTPAVLRDVDQLLFHDTRPPTTFDAVIGEMDAYIRRMSEAEGVKPHHVARHMAGLFHGEKGARAWRRELSAYGAQAPIDILMRARRAMQTDVEKCSA